MYGELMRIETLVERVAELKEANRRLQTLNAELVRDIEEAKKGYRVADMGWGAECSRLHHENERLKKENEVYKDMFTRMLNLGE
jgi:predicted RNase H-like nuclease (RuvC/YqgF family)